MMDLVLVEVEVVEIGKIRAIMPTTGVSNRTLARALIALVPDQRVSRALILLTQPAQDADLRQWREVEIVGRPTIAILFRVATGASIVWMMISI